MPYQYHTRRGLLEINPSADLSDTNRYVTTYDTIPKCLMYVHKLTKNVET